MWVPGTNWGIICNPFRVNMAIVHVSNEIARFQMDHVEVGLDAPVPVVPKSWHRLYCIHYWHSFFSVKSTRFAELYK